jgi:hypothetical protein
MIQSLAQTAERVAPGRAITPFFKQGLSLIEQFLIQITPCLKRNISVYITFIKSL